MTGPQLKYWRTSHGFTLREVSELLESEVNHTSLSRWEASQNDIPKWAEEKLLSSTKIELALDELHELMDLAREEKISFNELLADCIRQHLARRRAGHKFKLHDPHAEGLRAAEQGSGYDRHLG